LGKAGLSNGHGGGGFSSSEGYGRFSEDFLNRTFQFHNPFDIFEQFMSHFGADDDFGKLIINSLPSSLICRHMDTLYFSCRRKYKKDKTTYVSRIMLALRVRLLETQGAGYW